MVCIIPFLQLFFCAHVSVLIILLIFKKVLIKKYRVLFVYFIDSDINMFY